MARINVNRGATSLGIFSEDEVREGLRAGRFVATDLGWREGMTSWQPLSQFAEFAAETAGATPVSEITNVIAAASPAAEIPAARTGLPWEHRHERGFLNAFYETLVMVLSKPTVAFMTMKTEGGLGDPLIYAVIGGSFGLIVYFLFAIAMQSVGFFASRNNALAGVFGAGMGAVFCIILAPVFVALSLFIGAAIVHLCLMLVGGCEEVV